MNKWGWYIRDSGGVGYKSLPIFDDRWTALKAARRAIRSLTIRGYATFGTYAE